MGTIGSKFLTLKDVATRENIKDIAEIINETNDGILDDIHWEECNDGTVHKSAQRTGLPEVAWRELNAGVQPTKSTVATVTDTTGMMEALSQVDEKLIFNKAKLNEVRRQEDTAFVQAMGNEFFRTLFYGNSNTDPKKFLGFAPRYSDPAAGNGEMLVDAGGTGSDNTSAWLVTWGANKVFGIYPEGSSSGLSQRDNGRVKMKDANGGEYYGYETQFTWTAGLAVKNWKFAGRICNIDVSNLSGDSAADLVRKMIILSERVKSEGGRQAWYCSRKVLTALRLQILAKSNVNLSFENVAGKRIVMFDGIPVRRCDALLETEAQVTGTFQAL